MRPGDRYVALAAAVLAAGAVRFADGGVGAVVIGLVLVFAVTMMAYEGVRRLFERARSRRAGPDQSPASASSR